MLVLTDDIGNDVIFEFVAQTIPAQPTLPGSISVPFNTFDTVDVIADNLVLAINTANIGIPAQNLGIGRVSLGRIDSHESTSMASSTQSIRRFRFRD